jgi:hypothetical protein
MHYEQLRGLGRHFAKQVPNLIPCGGPIINSPSNSTPCSDASMNARPPL